MRARLIGDTFEDRGATLRVSKGNCSACFYNNGGLCTKVPLNFDCARSKRPETSDDVVYLRVSEHNALTCDHVPGLSKDYACPKCGEWIIVPKD
jgi:hypothetical protein